MERCSYCRQGAKNRTLIVHRAGCPQTLMDIYSEGWDDGRTGRPEKSSNPTYQMGHRNGVCALEEVENGHRPY